MEANAFITALRNLENFSAPLLESVSLSADHSFPAADRPPTHVYFPDTAVISASFASDDMHLETLTVGHDGAFGLLAAMAQRPIGLSAKVSQAGTAHRVDADALRAAATSDHRVLNLVLGQIYADVQALRTASAYSAGDTVPQRLARWLLVEADQARSHSLSASQADLAERLGVQRTTVTAAAILLKKRGLIAYSRGVIRLLDRDALGDLAAGAQAYPKGGRRRSP